MWATIRGRPRPVAFRRTLPDEQVAKALAVVGMSLALLAGAVILLLATQPFDPLGLIFEAVSACGTVGLSTGATAALNAWGKAVIILLVLVGRIGPLTLGFALAARSGRSLVTYPALSALKQMTKLPDQILLMGLGWLAREDKLARVRRPRGLDVSLRSP